MQINYDRNKPASVPLRSVTENQLSNYGQTAKKYKAFLHTLALSLGVDEIESEELVRHVCSAAEANYGRPAKSFDLKLRLSKIVVHNSIFKISTRMFSQSGNATGAFLVSVNGLIPKSIYEIPISFRTVYILIHVMGFSESETAYVLNSTPMQVKERLARAVAILKRTDC